MRGTRAGKINQWRKEEQNHISMVTLRRTCNGPPGGRMPTVAGKRWHCGAVWRYRGMYRQYASSVITVRNRANVCRQAAVAGVRKSERGNVPQCAASRVSNARYRAHVVPRRYVGVMFCAAWCTRTNGEPTVLIEFETHTEPSHCPIHHRNQVTNSTAGKTTGRTNTWCRQRCRGKARGGQVKVAAERQ